MMKKMTLMIAVLTAAALVSCSNDHGTEPGPFGLTALPAPTGLTVTAGTEQATISWDFPAESIGSVEEFRVYYYFEAFDQVELAGTTDGFSYVDTRLVGNVEYCYTVSAVDTSGMEGWRTEHECALIDTH